MAIFSRPKAASRVPSFQVPGLWLASAYAAVARARHGVSRAGQRVTRVGTLALSPRWWWAEITSATGVAVLLALSVVSLIVALVVTWPHR